MQKYEFPVSCYWQTWIRS